MKRKKIIRYVSLIVFVTCLIQPLHATKLIEMKVMDKDYLMLRFHDGIVEFVDDGLGSNAYSNFSDAANSKAKYYGTALDKTSAADVNSWTIKSSDDANYGEIGVAPAAVYRKTKVNGMSQGNWGASDWIFDYTYEHFIYLQLPNAMEENKTYTVELNVSLNSDTTSQSITYSIFNCPSEAIHTNLVGYLASSRMKSADLYHFMGDGGNRDYTNFINNKVYIYNVDTQDTTEVGSVSFWMANKKETYFNLTGSDVWNIDFTGFTQTGTYRLVVEGIGCSQDFEIKDDIYHDPYKVAVMGYFYMRIGQDNIDMVPVPRRPLYIQDQDPSNCEIYVTDMDPYHPDWDTFRSGDKWDGPTAWVSYKKAGNPTNPNAIGGHSDALDWDRHLGHVVNIYDLCLAYILSDGALDDDDLRIAESGNCIPDILDEARNEVDFWLSLRYQKGYSHGLTNPDGNNKLYQADNTPLAAWANSLNCAMLAYSFQIAGLSDLRTAYQDSAIIAYNYANNLADPMLDTRMEDIRGIDFKMMTAAYLYNLTGDTAYEDVIKAESVVTTSSSSIYQSGSYNQLWGTAAYLLTKREIHYSGLHANMKASIIAKAMSKEANKINQRPSRRGHADEQAWWQTNQDMHRTIIAHAVCDNPTDQLDFLDALLLEADWGLGRNPLNMIQMTTATTELADKRSIENCYTAGQDDGTPGVHPGHTPYLNIGDWGSTMVGSAPSKVLKKFYPSSDQWPHASKYINTRDMWAHSEFTPRQTMRGKTLLYAYLYNLSQTSSIITQDLIADAGPDQNVVDENESGKEPIQLDGSGSYSVANQIINYKWFSNNSQIATGQTAIVTLDTGRHKITLKVEDDGGESATDTVIIEIVIPTSDEEADYGFETTGELDDWLTSNNGEGGTPVAILTTEKARSGSYSLKLSGNYSINSANLIKKSGALEDDIESITYYVWIPQALVDSSVAVAVADESIAGGIQPYLMFTGWTWRDTWYNIYNLEGDVWNKISLEIPEDVANSEILEIGLVCNLQSAGMDEDSLYIDDIILKVADTPADYDFETATQFDDWIVENFSDSTGGTPVAYQSTEIVHEGAYSYKIQGNFIANSEHVLRQNNSLDAEVTALTYHIWLPQVMVDSAIAVYARETSLEGSIQNFVMHDQGQLTSEWYNIRKLEGDAWNTVSLDIPDDVKPTDIESFGISFKNNGINVGETSIYIDDIFFTRVDLTGIDDLNHNLLAAANEFKLFNNYPNPFNPETKIKYQLPEQSKVKIIIYDIMGHQVKNLINDNQNAGTYEITFNASDLASGVYLYVFQSGKFKDVKKMILLK